MVNLDAERTRLAHLRRDGRMSLSAMDPDDWYSHVSLQGRVASIADELQISAGAVKRYLSDGLAKMAVSLSSETERSLRDESRDTVTGSNHAQ